MSDDNGNWNNNGTNLFFDDRDKVCLLTSFRNLSLQSSNKNSSNNLNVQHNTDRVSLGGFPLSAASLRAPPFIPSWMAQPSASSYPIQPPALDPFNIDHFHELLEMMTCTTRYSEFLGLLASQYNNEDFLLSLGLVLIRPCSTFLYLAEDQNGQRALRALINRNPNLDRLMFKAVQMNFVFLMNNKHGHRLIIPIIRAVENPLKELLYQLTYQNTLFLAKQEVGCASLNNVFQEVKGEYREEIFNLIAENAAGLSFHPYGTHVVQNLLTLRDPSVTRTISERLYGSFCKLATVRQGSYLLEKCLKSSEFGLLAVLEEFRRNDREWIRLASDKFGNFVAKCALRAMKERGMIGLLREFVEKLRPHFGEMKYGYGRNTLKVIVEEIEGCI